MKIQPTPLRSPAIAGRTKTLLAGAIASTLFATGFQAAAQTPAPIPESFSWRTVVNNLDTVPGTDGKLFNSYNQPSINKSGYLVFRARSKGPEVMSGIYLKNMGTGGGPIQKIADRNSEVPAPNNTMAIFNEFPSIPRISESARSVATRGNSEPVWNYSSGEEETRVGTNGIFVFGNPSGALKTGANLLGAVPGGDGATAGANYFPYWQVPGAVEGTRFDVFPGSPAVADGDVIVFKANYTEDNVGKTGVFYRDTIGQGGLAPVQLIANTSTIVPNPPEGQAALPFGSTAPPSASGSRMVFLGLDNEENPTQGGIYLAPLSPSPALTPVAGIGDPVPGETDQTFNRFGEALSFDGRYVTFWASWGNETKTLWLDCPEDGNAALLAFCEEFVGDNFPVQVPVNQGIFVADTQTGTIAKVARTGETIADFVYWTFSGKPPGVGGSEEESDDGELPRWRSSAFVSVSRDVNGTFLAAFKARQGQIDPVENSYINPVDGIFVGNSDQVVSLLDTTQDGQLLDNAAPVGSKISALAIERESFRGTWLAVSATMLEPVSTESLAGIYLTNFPSPQSGSQSVSAGNGNPDPQPQLTAKERKREMQKLKKRISNLRKKLSSVKSFKKQSLRLQIQNLRQELAMLKN